MKFERSRVKTILDINEVYVGDEGYFSDCLLELKEIVESENKKFYGKIVDIDRESESDDVFKSDLNSIYRFYFYLLHQVEGSAVGKFKHPFLTTQVDTGDNDV